MSNTVSHIADTNNIIEDILRNGIVSIFSPTPYPSGTKSSAIFYILKQISENIF